MLLVFHFVLSFLCVSVVKIIRGEKQKTSAFAPENLRRLLPQFRGLRLLISLFGLTYEFGPQRPEFTMTCHNSLVNMETRLRIY